MKHTTSGAPSITKVRCLKSSLQSAGIAGAALKFLKRTMKRYGGPRVIVTDRLRSYAAAMNEPRRVFRRLFCLSQAAKADSLMC